MKLRTRQKGGLCYKCSTVTLGVFEAAIEQRRKEHQLARKSAEDDLDDLDLDDLDEVDEEVEVEEDEDELEVEEVDDEDEAEEDPDEAPKAKKRGRKAKAAKKPAAAKPKKGGIGTKEVADLAGVESRVLRQFLRSSGYQPREEREGRYTWPSANDPQVKEIVKRVKGGAVERLNKEKLSELKESTKAKKSGAKKTASKKTSAKRARSKK